MIFTADGRMSGDRYMAFQTRATPDLGMRANNTKRPNPNFIVEFGSRVYHSGVAMIVAMNSFSKPECVLMLQIELGYVGKYLGSARLAC